MNALSEVICYSEDNFSKFLNIINKRELSRVNGNKYIKDLYVDRKEIREAFNRFVCGDKKLFLITGQSGIGKTNTICNLAESNMDNMMILFYNSCFINTSLISQISEDFNFGFDEQLFNRQLFNRINFLSNKVKKPFIIIIDAIDELSTPNPSIDIDKLLSIIVSYSNIKVCMSCKDSYISDFEEKNGNFLTLKEIPKDNIRLMDFTDSEKNEIIKKYKSYYKVNIEDNVLNDIKIYCKDGFLFRIIFETYRNKLIKDKIEDISIIEKYIELISKNYDLDSKELKYSIKLIGEMLVDNVDEWPMKLIEETIIDDFFRVKRSTITVDFLVNINVLQRYSNNSMNYIDFYFKPLSYYVITILVEKLNKKHGKDFIESLFKLNNNRRCKEALIWYDNYVGNYQYFDLYNFKKEYGKKIIYLYRKIVNNNFFNIKDRFELEIDINNVGIAVNKNSCIIHTYGFYKKENINDDVRLIDFKEKDVLNKNKIYAFTSTLSNISVPNIIKEKIKKIIKNRNLSEDKCKYLNIEYILNNIFLYGKVYGLKYKYEKLNFIPNFNEFIPLDLLSVRKSVLLFNIENLKMFGEIDANLDSEKIYNDIIDGKIIVPESNYAISGIGKVPIYEFFNRITKFIINFSITSIDQTYLSIPKCISKPKSSFIQDIIIETFSEEELRKYLKDLLSKYIEEYINIVEYNFPTFKDRMQNYNLFKNGVLLELYLYKKEKSSFGKYSKILNYCCNDKNEVKIYLCDEKNLPKEINQKCLYSTWGGANNLFYDNRMNNFLTRNMVLSNLVYELLKLDFDNLLKNEDDIFNDELF